VKKRPGTKKNCSRGSEWRIRDVKESQEWKQGMGKRETDYRK
jgi:hypothetical protein